MANEPFRVNVSSKYGAPMGRQSSQSLFGKVLLFRVPFEDGCYDPGGAYWGAPANLYCAWDSEGAVVYLRADSRAQAKAALLEKHVEGDGTVTFYR
jgi:hypothetical protein